LSGGRQGRNWGKGARDLRQIAHLVAILAPLLALAGCGGGFGLSQVEADHSLVTSSVDNQAASDTELSDRVTIRNAVTSANLAELKGTPISWANADTGSQGLISAVGEYQEQGRKCRRFQVSRESFSGVALYRGDVCLETGGNWSLRAFEAA
jgi:surface antigen